MQFVTIMEHKKHTEKHWGARSSSGFTIIQWLKNPNIQQHHISYICTQKHLCFAKMLKKTMHILEVLKTVVGSW